MLREAGYKDEALPSCVPDWTVPSPHTGLQYAAYNASGIAQPKLKVEDDILTVQAMTVDRVTGFSGRVFDGDNWHITDEVEIVTSQNIPVYRQSALVSINDQTEQDAMLRALGVMANPGFPDTFWRTLTADISDSKRPATEEFASSLKILRSRLKEDPSS